MMNGLGIDLDHIGLYCRYGHGCRLRFIPVTGASEPHLAEAISRRNDHEHKIHEYSHVPTPVTVWGYQRLTTMNGRSRLSRRSTNGSPFYARDME